MLLAVVFKRLSLMEKFVRVVIRCLVMDCEEMKAFISGSLRWIVSVKFRGEVILLLTAVENCGQVFQWASLMVTLHGQMSLCFFPWPLMRLLRLALIRSLTSWVVMWLSLAEA